MNQDNFNISDYNQFMIGAFVMYCLGVILLMRFSEPEDEGDNAHIVFSFKWPIAALLVIWYTIVGRNEN